MIKEMFIRGVNWIIILEFDTHYFIGGASFKMVKSRYTNLGKKMGCSGYSFSYVSKLIIRCTNINEKKTHQILSHPIG